MVGICGLIKDQDSDLNQLSERLIWLGSEKQQNYVDENIKISSVFHDSSKEKQPVEANDGNVLIWIWGEIFGYGKNGNYISKTESHPDLPNAEYCAKLYENHGLEFIKGLNSEFAGVIYDRKKNKINIFTDRLSSRPIFYARPSEDSLVFSTSIQSVANHNSVELNWDLNGVFDFFKTGRVYGLKTILENVKQIHPASIYTFDLKSKKFNFNIYWKPKYEPKSWSFDEISEKFYRLMRKVLSEQTHKDQDYGLLLSGGSDSRLITSLTEKKLIGLHMNEKMNREAKLAKKIADLNNHDFVFLKRKTDYYLDVLEKTADFSNFINWFEQGQTAGFVEEIRKETDCVLTGNYGDTFLSAYPIQMRYNLPSQSGHVPFPFMMNYNDLDTFDKFGKHSRNNIFPSYLENSHNISEIYNEKVTDGGISFHGVKHPSLKDLLTGPWYYYPLTNSYFFLFYNTLVQTLPARHPFLDNRIVDFSLQIPVKYRLRRDIVNRTLCKSDLEIAEFPHSNSNLPLTAPRLLHILTEYAQEFSHRIKPKKDVNYGISWPDYDELIRESDIVGMKLEQHSEILEKCDFISKNEVRNVYEEHLEGKDNFAQLYPLLSFLEHPITKETILGKSS